MRRATKVHAIDVSPSPGSKSDGDFIKAIDCMNPEECASERSSLMHEKARLENEIQAEKARGSGKQLSILGTRYQALCARLGLVTKRMKQLNHDRAFERFKQATKDIVGDETFHLICARHSELGKIERKEIDGE